MAQEAPRMPKEELKEKLDDPQVEVIDVRQPKGDNRRIPILSHTNTIPY